jgi:hypothetical protein
MDDLYDRQKIQEDLQRSNDFTNVFSKIVSGKAGYKTIVDVKPITTKCACGTNLDERQKFCHECGAKNEHFKQEKK